MGRSEGQALDSPEFLELTSGHMWPDGPVVLGVGWDFSLRLVRMAAGLAVDLGRHLVCAYVDPAGYLAEWEPSATRAASTLDPAPNDEAHFPSGQVLRRLEDVLGPPGDEWTFRVLNGDVAQALIRLSDSADASFVVVGGQRPGVLAGMDRILGGSVSGVLTRSCRRPVLIVPDAPR